MQVTVRHAKACAPVNPRLHQAVSHGVAGAKYTLSAVTQQVHVGALHGFREAIWQGKSDAACSSLC